MSKTWFAIDGSLEPLDYPGPSFFPALGEWVLDPFCGFGTTLVAYYREFVQLERPKKNGQFGANRTVVFGDAERGGGRDAV